MIYFWIKLNTQWKLYSLVAFCCVCFVEWSTEHVDGLVDYFTLYCRTITWFSLETGHWIFFHPNWLIYLNFETQFCFLKFTLWLLLLTVLIVFCVNDFVWMMFFAMIINLVETVFDRFNNQINLVCGTKPVGQAFICVTSGWMGVNPLQHCIPHTLINASASQASTHTLTQLDG